MAVDKNAQFLADVVLRLGLSGPEDQVKLQLLASGEELPKEEDKENENEDSSPSTGSARRRTGN